MLTLEQWVAKHPYLEPIARLDAAVEDEIGPIPLRADFTPSWDRYLDDYLAGVPLLESGAVMIDLTPVEITLPLFAGRLASRLVLPAESPGLTRYLQCRLLS